MVTLHEKKKLLVIYFFCVEEGVLLDIFLSSFLKLSAYPCIRIFIALRHHWAHI